jgi:hypothetical protein
MDQGLEQHGISFFVTRATDGQCLLIDEICKNIS